MMNGETRMTRLAWIIGLLVALALLLSVFLPLLGAGAQEGGTMKPQSRRFLRLRQPEPVARDP
jgi:hypothetical protein